jgi:beta-1,4-mannosyltransferase
MCYHASSLACHGVNVELVGYSGSKPHRKILESDLIKIVNLPTAPKWFNSVPRFLQLFLKLVFMFFTLSWTLLFKTSFHVSILLVQNPPGIPSMIICYCVSQICARLLISLYLRFHDSNEHLLSLIGITIAIRCYNKRSIKRILETKLGIFQTL